MKVEREQDVTYILGFFSPQRDWNDESSFSIDVVLNGQIITPSNYNYFVGDYVDMCNKLEQMQAAYSGNVTILPLIDDEDDNMSVEGLYS